MHLCKCQTQLVLNWIGLSALSIPVPMADKSFMKAGNNRLERKETDFREELMDVKM